MTRILISDLDVLRSYMHQFAGELKKYPQKEIQQIINLIQDAMDIANKRIQYMSISKIHHLINLSKEPTIKLAKKYNNKKLIKKWKLLEQHSQWWLDIALEENIN